MKRLLPFCLLASACILPAQVAADVVVATRSGLAQVRVIAEAAVPSLMNVTEVPNKALTSNFFAFDLSFTGGATVAGGDINGDGIPDLLVGMASLGQQVLILDGESVQAGLGGVIGAGDDGVLSSFQAFSPLIFSGGVNVAAGDVNGDGFDDVVVGMASNGSVLRILDGQSLAFDGELVDLYTVFPFGVNYTNGIDVAVAKDGPCGARILVTGGGSGMPATGQVRYGTGEVLETLMPFGAFTGRVSSALGFFDADPFPEPLMAASQNGALSTLSVLSGADGSLMASFFAFTPDYTGGVNIAVGDVNNDGVEDIIAGANLGITTVRVIDGTRLDELLPSGEIAPSAELASFFAYGSFYAGGVNVGVLDTFDARIPEPRLDITEAVCVSFDTLPDCTYTIQSSPDARTWSDEEVIPGEGGTVVRYYLQDEDRQFFRVVRSR